MRRAHSTLVIAMLFSLLALVVSCERCSDASGTSVGPIKHLGVHVDCSVPLPIGEPCTLTHRWKATETIPAGWRLFMHLRAHNGRRFVNVDHVPHFGELPLHEFVVDQVVTDTHLVSLPGDWTATKVDLVAGLWDGKQRWPLPGTEDNAARLATFDVAPLPALKLPEVKPPSRPLPHIVLVSIDTLRRDHLGLYGYSKPTSPTLDALARESWVFDNAIAAHTNTGPSHSSMLTGRLPLQHGVWRNCHRIRRDVPTLPQLLQQLGYNTLAAISGWTMTDRCVGLGRGFGTYDDEELGNGHRRSEDTIARLLLALPTEPAQPQFIFLHLFDPHFPYEPPPPFDAKFLPRGQSFMHPGTPLARRQMWTRKATRREITEYEARYDGEIAYADAQLGQFFQEIRRRRIWDDAHVIVLSDHGETLGEREHPFDHGARVTEEQIRIPWLWKPPGGTTQRRIRRDMHHIDLWSTLFELLDVEPPPHEGVSAAQLLKDPQRDDKAGHRTTISYARAEPRSEPTLPVHSRFGLVTAARRSPHKLVAIPTRDLKYIFQRVRTDSAEKVLLSSSPDYEALRLSITPHLASGPAPMDDDELPAETLRMLESLGYVESP